MFLVLLLFFCWLAATPLLAPQDRPCGHACQKWGGAEEALERGHHLMLTLLGDTSSVEVPEATLCCTAAHLHAVADMMTYLNGLAHKKGQGFCEGTFVIEDPFGRIYSFLLSYRHVYKRISSHFGEYQAVHYGLDIPWSSRSRLLFGRRKRHLLFGKLNDTLLFIKPENYGTRLSIPTDFLMHTQEYINYLVRTIMRIGFERSDWREERIPLAIVSAWKAFLTHWLDDREMIDRLVQRTSREGIKTIFAYKNNIENKIAKPTQLQCLVRDRLNGMIEGYDHCSIRRGREVILTAAELFEPR